MKSISTILCFILILNNCYAQNKEKMQKQYIDLSEELTVKEFKDMVGFILKNGDRQTYCNMYNNNPHYKFEGFEVFLNPIHQTINWTNDNLSNEISDYNAIVIRDLQANGSYYYLKLNENNILFDDIYNQYDEKERNLIRNKILNEYLPKMKREFGKME
jgi:hypothetical protein